MGNIASGHFKPTNNIQEKHNDRTLSPSYLLPEEFRGQNEVNRSSHQARQLKERIIENAKETYLIAFKQKLKSKSYLWSLVVNIKTNTTMSDLEKLAEHFEVKYGFQCYQIAIHRDEGYIDENTQEPHANHHAHMEFVTLNKENGKNMWRQINHIKLRQIQTEIAQILGMERGIPKRISGAKRIEPRAWAQMKNKERKALNTLKQEKNTLENKLQDKDKTNSEQAQTIQAKEKEIATLNTLNAKLEKTNKDLKRPSLWDIINEKYIDSTKNKREIETKDKEIDTLKQEKTDLESIIQEKDKEIATALDTANCYFRSKAETLQEAVERNKSVNEQYFSLGFLYNNPKDTHELFDKHKDKAIFSKLWNAIKLLYSIIEKLFGDKNAKKDNQEIINTITELQERPTKQELEAKDKEIDTLKSDKWWLNLSLKNRERDLEKAQERIKTLESNETTLKNDLNAKESVIQTKEQEINTLKQEKTTLTNKLQEQDKTINELNQFKNSSNLALDLEKSLKRIKTLESNETTLKNDLNAKDKELQDKETTINELKKQIQALEYNYNQERERMKAENKRLQEQGLDKIYTQKDYEALKAEHNEQIEALKKKLKEQDKYKIQAQSARYRQAQQSRAMKTKQTPTPSPTPQPTYTYTKRM